MDWISKVSTVLKSSIKIWISKLEFFYFPTFSLLFKVVQSFANNIILDNVYRLRHIQQSIESILEYFTCNEFKWCSFNFLPWYHISVRCLRCAWTAIYLGDRNTQLPLKPLQGVLEGKKCSRRYITVVIRVLIESSRIRGHNK